MPIERVNLNWRNEQSDGPALGGAMSNDGRYVVFMSTAADILGGPPRGAQIYLRDMETDSTQLITRTGVGGDVRGVGISADGRYVAWSSDADNVVEGDEDGRFDVFVLDRDSGEVRMISDSLEYDCFFDGAISADGQNIAYFEDRSVDLPGDDRGLIKNVQTGEVLVDTDESWTYSGKRMNYQGIFWVADGEHTNELHWAESKSYTMRRDTGSLIGNNYSNSLSSSADNWNFSWGILGDSGLFGQIQWSNAYRNVSEMLYGAYLFSLPNSTKPTYLEQVRGLKGELWTVFTSNFDYTTHEFNGGWAIYVWDGISTNAGSHTPVIHELAMVEGATSNPFLDVRFSPNGHYVSFVTNRPMVAGDTNGAHDVYRVENPLWSGEGQGGEQEFPDPDAWIMGTPDEDELIGTGRDDRIDALAGDDKVHASVGDDLVYLREGDDEAYGGLGDDEIYGGDGDDVISGDEGQEAAGGDDFLFGGAGEDDLYGEEGDDELDGGADDDALFGGEGDDRIEGGDGDDHLDGGRGDDILAGDDGDDVLFGDWGDDKFTNDDGDDIIDGGDNQEIGDDIDTVYMLGRASNYEFEDAFDNEIGQFVTTSTSLLDGEVDRMIRIERALFEELPDNEVESQGPLEMFARAALASYEDEASLGYGWRPLSALELGIRMGAMQEEEEWGYNFKNGVYDAFEEAPGPGGPLINANAHVYFGKVAGQNTLMLAFRGTDQGSDLADYPQFAMHYAKYEPLIQAVLDYVNNDGHTRGGEAIDRVYVTGHSLGGAMAQLFMQDERVQFDDRFSAVSFGSPGAEKNTGDPRMLHVEHTADLVPFAGDIARGLGPLAWGLAWLLDKFVDNPRDYRTSGGVIRVSLQESDLPTVQHSMDHYLASSLRLDGYDEVLNDLGFDGAPSSVFNVAVASDAGGELDGASPIRPALLRGVAYTDGSEVFLLGEGADEITGGLGRDVFAGSFAQFQNDTITDLGDGDRITLLGDYDGAQLNYTPWANPREGGTLRITHGTDHTVMTILGWHPGDFAPETLNGMTTFVYEGSIGLGGGAAKDDLSGGDGDDLIEGAGGDDTLAGGRGDDEIVGGEGSDTIYGQQGDDLLYGDDRSTLALDVGLRSTPTTAFAPGDVDTAAWTVARNNYSVTVQADGGVLVTDLRFRSPDGTDTLYDFEAFQFSDRTYTLAELIETPPPPPPPPGQGEEPGSPVATVAGCVEIFERMSLGRAPDATTQRHLASIADQAAKGVISEPQALLRIAELHDAATAVALQTYQFFTGKTPTSDGLAWLVNSTGNAQDLNDAYYAAFNQESRYINFSVNLALSSANAGKFAQDYAGLTFSQTISSAYDLVIGDQLARSHYVDTAAAVAFFGRAENIDFLTRLAGGSDNPDLFMKAAVIGQMLSIGAGTSFGRYSAASNQYLVALGLDEAVSESIDMISHFGVYNTPTMHLDWA
ncbi:lipase family protein [Caulobacter sp. NIBR2454]|uniref:lipase family protein n=1 Tax=Caulobacter sp. NIBR2454 TaxID=3015996 RepID=UPI0022B6D794|nr:Mbeg1-like protein [Caulobacter sp. NIBR2454]